MSATVQCSRCGEHAPWRDMPTHQTIKFGNDQKAYQLCAECFEGMRVAFSGRRADRSLVWRWPWVPE